MVESKDKNFEKEINELQNEIQSLLEKNPAYNKDFNDLNLALIGDDDSMICTFKDFLDDNEEFAKKLSNIILFLDDNCYIPQSYFTSREFFRVFCTYFVPLGLTKFDSEYLREHIKHMWKELLLVNSKNKDLDNQEKIEVKDEKEMLNILQAIFNMLTIINCITKILIFGRSSIIKNKFDPKKHNEDDLVYEEMMFIKINIKEELIKLMPDYHESRIIFNSFKEILKSIDADLFDSVSTFTKEECRNFLIPDSTLKENLNPFNLDDLENEENEAEDCEEDKIDMEKISKKIKFSKNINLEKVIEALSNIDVKQLLITNSFAFSSKKELDDFDDFEDTEPIDDNLSCESC